MLQFHNNPVHVQVEHKRNDAGPWLWAWRIAVLLALLALIAVMAAKADAEPRQPKPKPQPVAYTLTVSGRALEANRAAAALAAPQTRSEGTLSFDSSGYVYVDCPGCTGVTGFADNSAFTVGTTPVTVLAGYYTTGSAPTISNGDAGRVRIDSNSYLYVDCAAGCSGGGSGSGSNFGSAFPSTGAAFGATNGTNMEPLQVNGSGYLEALLENASIAVTGTFWQSTQPVSLSSLPSLGSGSNTIGAVTQASGPWAINLTQIGGASVGSSNPLYAELVSGSTTAATQSGTWNIGTVTAITAISSALPAGTNTIGKIDVLGNAGAAFDAATNAAPPVNGIQTIAVAATSLPSAATATNTVAPMADKFGRQVVLIGGMRDIVSTANVQTTNNTQTTLIAAISSTYADLASLDITTESATACIVSLTDGTVTYKYNVGSAQGFGFVKTWTVPLPASSSNTAWQVTGCSGVTLDYNVEYLKDK